MSAPYDFDAEGQRITTAVGDLPTPDPVTAPVEKDPRVWCSARLGRKHDFSMGRAAPRRCWFCCQTRAQVDEATKKPTA